MKKVLGLMALFMLGSGLFAGEKTPKIEVNWRLDAVKNDTDDKTKTYGTGEGFKFQIPYIRFGVKGVFDESLSYRARFRLNKTLAKGTNGDETGQGLDYAYVDKKINGDLKLRIGKQALYHGGWEAAISSKEEYSFSANSFSYYAVGVAAFYQIAAQNLIFQVLNNGNDSKNQSTPLYGVSWSSVFFNGVINPIATYHIDPFENSAAGEVKGENTYLAFGNRLKVKDFTFDFDYQINKADKTTVTGKALKNKGYVARMAYQWGLWRPQIKYSRIATKGKIQGSTAGLGDDIDYHIALEYYPHGKANFRYHLAYIASKFEFEGNTGTDTRDTAIKLGMAGNF